uniref:Uncharacterized protein n=1 Tax=uncultured microorganism TaxID=358574 RepID=I2FJN6_9ZZZZ|nr:hypothetical protein [uncultured microorganism]
MTQLATTARPVYVQPSIHEYILFKHTVISRAKFSLGRSIGRWKVEETFSIPNVKKLRAVTPTASTHIFFKKTLVLYS